MPIKPIPFKVRDFRNKGFFVIDDVYLNGYAKHLTPSITVIYLSLCRHADKAQSCFPAQKLIALEHGITERTVRRCLDKLVELNIIKIVRKRDKGGKWLRNNYFLLDKTLWKKPSGHGCPVDNQRTFKTKPRGHQRPIKDTHIKDTHSLYNKGDSFGNPEVNEAINYFQEKFNLPMLDGSTKQNRRYAWLLLKKFGGRGGVQQLIDYAILDSFWGDKIASLQKLYYKGVEIISKKRGGTNVNKIATL